MPSWLSSVRAHAYLFTLGIALLLLLGTGAGRTEPAPYDARDRMHPVHARKGLVVAQEALASQVGLDILQQGGNAADAAVAVGFALAVTLPQAGNLGGGGFLLVHDAAQPAKRGDRFPGNRPRRRRAGFLSERTGRGRRNPHPLSAIRRPACRARWPDWRWLTPVTAVCRGGDWSNPPSAWPNRAFRSVWNWRNRFRKPASGWRPGRPA